MEPFRHRGGGRCGRMFVSGVELGFWPGDFGFLGANSVVAVTVCSIARISRSVGGHDVKHRGLRQPITSAIALRLLPHREKAGACWHGAPVLLGGLARWASFRCPVYSV